MLRTVDSVSDGYSPRCRADNPVESYMPLSPMSPDSAADGTASVDYEGWSGINHQVDVGTLNGTNFTAFANQLRKTAANCPPCGEGTVVAPGTYVSGAVYLATMLLNGKVLICPAAVSASTTMQIFDPVTNKVTISSAAITPNTGSINSLVLLNDGRVFMGPADTTARIYDPSTDTLTVISTSVSSGITSAFGMCLLLSDGRVFIVPRNSTTARIYDPVANVISTPSATFPGGSNPFVGGAVLMNDGRVFIAPLSSTTARIYDPFKDTLIVPSGTYPGSNAFNNAILLPDGRIYIVCRGVASNNTSRIYDPVTDTLITPTGTFPSPSGQISGGILMPDGRILCIPGVTSTTARIYDPVTDTLITPAGTYAGINNGYAGCVILPDGRMFVTPGSTNTQALLVGQKISNLISKNRLTSPFYSIRRLN